MGWLLEIAIGAAAQAFGHAVGHEQPWWVGFLAALGFLLAVIAVPMLLWDMLR